MSHWSAQLFHYNDIEPTNEFIWHEIPFDRFTPCYWEQKNKKYRPDSLSSAFTCQSTGLIKLVVEGHRAIIGFMIPLRDNSLRDTGVLPQSLTLVDSYHQNTRSDSTCFGLHKGIVRALTAYPTNVPRPVTISYSWPDETGTSQGQVLTKDAVDSPYFSQHRCLVGFNEFTGRTLILPQALAQVTVSILILELALIR